MRVAVQCQPGEWKNKEGWIPKCAWGEDDYVQWGGRGLVFVEDGDNYRTAFFEAFTKEPDTFIRGEGSSVEEAEADAFQKYERYRACENHEFERRKYRNGAGFCKHCGLFKSQCFEPLSDPYPSTKLSRLFEAFMDDDEDEYSL